MIRTGIDRSFAPVSLQRPEAFPPRVVEKFWAKVNRGLPDDCWFWIGGTTGGKRYGTHCFSNRFEYAHRFSYILHYGQIPGGQVVMHLCDETLCVNPRHLATGTQKENIHDSLRKGRWMTQARKDYLAQPPDRRKDGRFAPKLIVR